MSVAVLRECRSVNVTMWVSAIMSVYASLWMFIWVSLLVFISHCGYLWGGPKGVINFWGIFLCNAEFSPCWALPEYIRALIHLACLRVFSVTPWVIVYRLYRVRWQGQSDWFQKITLDPFRMVEYRISKASTVSIITAFTRHRLSTDIFFSLTSVKYDIKIQNAAIWRFLD